MQRTCFTPECAMAFAREKEDKKKRREFNKVTRERKEAIKTKPELEKAAQSAFNAYIRERDRGRPCPTCGKPEEVVEIQQGWKTGGAWDCGHILSVGSNPQLRFYSLNAMRQCKSCNGGQKQAQRFGNDESISEAYEAAAGARWGPGHMERLRADQVARKYSKAQLRRMPAIFRRKARQLVKRRAVK